MAEKLIRYGLFTFSSNDIIISPTGSISKNNFVILPSVFSMFNCVFE